MAKIASTINIEKSFWDIIDNYQIKYDLGSRNTAIECILSEYRALKDISSIIKNTNINQSESIIKDNNKEEDLLTKRLKQMEDDMQD